VQTTLGRNSTYQNKKKSISISVQKHLVCELELIFQHDKTFVGVLFNEVLSISSFHQCSLQMRHILVQTASSIFTTNISGKRRILMVQTILDTSSSSALMCGQGLLVIVW
jgi:hypothetical protein